MSIELIPPGSSAVISEHRGHGDHDRHSRHPDNWDLSTEMQRDLNQMTSQAERNAIAAAVASCKTDDKVSDSELNTQKAIDYHFEKTQKQLSDSSTATVVGFKDAQAVAYQIQGQSLLEASKNAAALSVQATLNQYNILLDSQKNAAAAALAAQACCCELKEKIGEEGQKTRDLINAQTVQDLRDRAARSETALVAYFSRNLVPTVPVV
jgi:hypothetical protein